MYDGSAEPIRHDTAGLPCFLAPQVGDGLIEFVEPAGGGGRVVFQFSNRAVERIFLLGQRSELQFQLIDTTGVGHLFFDIGPAGGDDLEFGLFFLDLFCDRLDFRLQGLGFGDDLVAFGLGFFPACDISGERLFHLSEVLLCCGLIGLGDG